MIPVEVTSAPWHYTTFWDWLDHWQTLVAGVLAFAAGFLNERGKPFNPKSIASMLGRIAS